MKSKKFGQNKGISPEKTSRKIHPKKTYLRKVIWIFGIVIFVAFLGLWFVLDGNSQDFSIDLLKKIQVPKGFQISLYARVPEARSLTLGDQGTLFVGTREKFVYAIPDKNGDGVAESSFVVANNLYVPNGVAFRDGSLYVAEISRILKYEDIENRLDSPPQPKVIREDYPTDTHHGWKFISFGPDGWLYVPVGAPCNVCKKSDPQYASITRIHPETKEFEVYAQGVRNTVGFDWHPENQELWFTDNGRDWLGDNQPPDELNHAPQKGLHFGFPFCHGKNISDPKFGKSAPCSKYRSPVQELGPHVAALGMEFYTGSSFPKSYQNQIFIAEHGSWNRSTPIGYRITNVVLKNNRALSYKVFAQGWLDGSKAWGRPVDIEMNPKDGSLFVSDDRAGAIYRISYTP